MESVTIEEIKKFLTLNTGSGYGDGSGSGYGFGNGYGYGYGFSPGYGNYDGKGYGNPNSYGYDTDGSDTCNSDADYDDGCSVYDIKSFNGFPVFNIDYFPTIFYSIKGNFARGAILRENLTLSDCYIARVDDSFAHGYTLADAVRAATDKALEVMPEDERIGRFRAEFPSLQTTAKCSTFYTWHHILTGSCEFGRNEFVKAHGLDMDKDYTVDYFLSITQESYGGKVIKKLRESYEK